MFERHNGKISLYTSVGGYPIVYLSNNARTTLGYHLFCPECADEMCQDEDDVTEDNFTGRANYETPTTCDVCGRDIEAAYADDDE